MRLFPLALLLSISASVPAQQYAAPPPGANGASDYGCTAWRWDATQNKYISVRSACN